MNFILLSLTGLLEQPLSGKGDVINAGFVVFLLCFLINVYFFGTKPRFLLSMLDEFVHTKERHSIFFEASDSTFRDKLLIIFQTILVLNMILYPLQFHQNPEMVESSSQLWLMLKKGVLLLLFYFIYKFITYNIIGWVFYTKEQIQQWNSLYLSLTGLTGIALFLPALIFFFIANLFYICLYFIAFILIFAIFIRLFTIYRIFFQNKGGLHQFILYLCAQEIIPLFLLYKGLTY